MLAVSVDLLTGRYVATAYNDRYQAEWPPHPARLFSALVAALPRDNEPPDTEAAEALLWLESLSAPHITASDASHRAVTPTYVPVNDNVLVKLDDLALDKLAEFEAQVAAATTPKERKSAESAWKKALKKHNDNVAKAIHLKGEPSASERKTATQQYQASGLRQARTFPSVTPRQPQVVYHWPNATPTEAQRSALDRLAARVTRLGHSSSLVSVGLVDAPPPPTLVPHPQGDLILRVPGPGQLHRLEAAFAVHQETEPRVLPCAFARYAPPNTSRAESTPNSVFGRDWVVFRRIAGPMFPPSATALLSGRLRAALMAHCPAPIPWALSGHQPDGAPALDAHAAFLSLPFVGHEHADGCIRGLAMVLPRDLSDREREHVLAAVAAWEDAAREDDEAFPTLPLHFGDAGTLFLERVVDRAPLRTLRAGTWCAASKTWGTVTPIALDRNPGELRTRDRDRLDKALASAVATIERACTRIGLPCPVRVEVQPGAPFVAGEPIRAFPPFPAQPGRTRRVQVHARLTFAEPVSGPVILGAGRFVGLGLCRPLPSED